MRISDWSSDVCSSDLSPFTAENGATRLWPHSHRPDADPMPDAEPIAIEMEPGSVLLFLGSTLHGGGENMTQMVRRGVIVSYCLGWLRCFENQYSVYHPEVPRNFDPELAALHGYATPAHTIGTVRRHSPTPHT